MKNINTLQVLLFIPLFIFMKLILNNKASNIETLSLNLTRLVILLKFEKEI